LAQLIDLIAERVALLYPDPVKPAQLESLVHIATDVVATFDGVEGAGAMIAKGRAAPASWTLFQRAVNGEPFAALLDAVEASPTPPTGRPVAKTAPVTGFERVAEPGSLRRDDIIGLTADLAAAYVSRNPVPASDLPGLIASVHRALTGVGTEGQIGLAAGPGPQQPAAPIEQSITTEYLVCLEDGRKFKSLKHHLRSKYNISPDEYRKKWGLPKNYPMVAPAYAAERSPAKQAGLGQKATARRGSKAAV
jgi:predicted transcriptional regulator